MLALKKIARFAIALILCTPLIIMDRKIERRMDGLKEEFAHNKGYQ